MGKKTEIEWELKTADTHIKLKASDNGPVITELSNPEIGWNWTPVESTLKMPDEISYIGEQKLPVTWKYQNDPQNSGDGKVRFTFVCEQIPEISITSVWWAASKTLPGPVQHNFTVANGSNKSISIYPQPKGIDIDVASDNTATLWRFNKDKHPIDDIGVYADVLTGGSEYAASAFDDTLGGGFLPLAVLDIGSDHGIYAGWEWQIGYVGVSAKDDLNFTVHTGYDNGADDGQNGPDVPEGRLDVGAMASFEMPASYLGAYKGDVDDGTNRFKRWFWNNKVPGNLRDDPTEPWTQYGGMFYYYTEEDKNRLVDMAKGEDIYYWLSDEPTLTKALTGGTLKDIGFESIEIDYGWWGSLKYPMSFDALPELFPEGMGKIGQMAHDNGFRFNLYFCNQVNEDTKQIAADKYREYNLDCWRSDFGRPDIGVLDWLAGNIPGYRYETCNGGGTNKDFATYARATVGTVTDNIAPLPLRKAFYDSSYALPPAQISQCNHIGYIEFGGAKAVLDETTDEFTYCLRSGMLGAMFPAVCSAGPVTNPANIILPDDEPLTVPIYKRNVAIYKKSLRPLIREANLYHILPRPDGVNWDGIEYYDPISKRGAIMLFKTSEGIDRQNIVLKGLEPDLNYTVEFADRPEQNTVLTGAALMKNGLPVEMTGKLVSEIILFDC